MLSKGKFDVLPQLVPRVSKSSTDFILFSNCLNTESLTTLMTTSRTGLKDS